MAKSSQNNPTPVAVAKALHGITFPADKQQLIEHAKKERADEDVVAMLEKMPDGEFDDVADVMRGYKEAE
jgi:hypothetical protein